MLTAAILIIILQSLVIGTSLVGLGYQLTRICNLQSTYLGWPLFALIGLCAAVYLSALNVFLFHCNAELIHSLIVIVGIVCCSVYRKTIFGKPKLPKGIALNLVLLNYLVWLAILLKTLYMPMFDIFDDHVAFIHYVDSIIERANLVDPFSFRRVTHMGGQSLAQALFVTFQRAELAPIFESGFVNLIVISFLYQFTHKLNASSSTVNASLVASFVGILFQLSEQYRINVTAQSTSLLFFLVITALIFEVSRSVKGSQANDRQLLLIAFLSSFFLLFKNSGMVPATIAIAFVLACASARLKVRCLSLVALIIAPFTWGLYVSSNTPLFPLVQGNVINNGVLEGPKEFLENLTFVFISAVDSHLFVMVIFGVLLYWFHIQRNRVVALASVAIFYFVVVSAFALGVERESMMRFLYPVITTTIYIFIIVFAIERKPAKVNIWGQCIFVFVFSIFFVTSALQRLTFYKIADDPILETMPQILSANHRDSQKIRALQKKIPEGEVLVTLVPRPYLIDKSRNPVHGIDQLGMAAPIKPFPTTGSEYDAYFYNQGYRYLLFRDPNLEGIIYGKSRWLGDNRYPQRIASAEGLFERFDLQFKHQLFNKRKVPYPALFEFLDTVMSAGTFEAHDDEYYIYKFTAPWP